MKSRLPLLVIAFTTAALAWPAAADGLRDPTSPPVAALRPTAAREAAPVLSAVMGPEGARVAIFNGQLVRSGGTVGIYAIDAVFADGVRYRHAGVSRELRLPHNAPIKKSSAVPARTPMRVQ